MSISKPRIAVNRFQKIYSIQNRLLSVLRFFTQPDREDYLKQSAWGISYRHLVLRGGVGKAELVTPFLTIIPKTYSDAINSDENLDLMINLFDAEFRKS